MTLLLLLAISAPLCIAEESDSGHHSKYVVAGFIGATNVFDGNEFTLGIEAGMNLSDLWTVGAVYERAEREKHSSLWLIGVGWHPFGPEMRIQFALGKKDPTGNKETVARLGFGYELELTDRWFLKPYIAADFIDNEENETVFGVYVGRGF